MVHVSRRIAPEALLPADPGYGNPPKRRPAVLLSDWNPASKGPHVEVVEVYSNADRVELFLNGHSLGAKAVEPLGAPCIWDVPFESGALRASAFTGGRVVATDELRTAGPAAAIRLQADVLSVAPGWDNVAFVRATVVDANGVRVPGARALVTFHVEGPGTIAAVDNADNSSHEAFNGVERRAYQGRCLAVVRATGFAGVIRLSASADGLQADSVAIAAEPASQ
jgi:beta-galactosidase